MFINSETRKWLDDEFQALVEFAKRSRTDVGFGTLDAEGVNDPAQGAQLWINCRMTHTFCLALLRGDKSARPFAEHGIGALLHNFRDFEYGGFYSNIALDGSGPLATPEQHEGETPAGATKAAYAHAFVLLAASSGLQAGIPGARELFDLATAAHEQHFWDPQFGLVRESWNREFTQTEDYRGANANMHTLEASLAAWDASGDTAWLVKAGQILHFVLAAAAELGNRIPEHFDSQWHLLPNFNVEHKADPFRPYGATPGHGIEWARLALQYWVAVTSLDADQLATLEQSLRSAPSHTFADVDFPTWLDTLPTTGLTLFEQALSDGWDADGAPGIVYTTTFDGDPIVHERMHWTICEGIAAAAAFGSFFEANDKGELADEMLGWLETFLDFAIAKLIVQPGMWIHELDRHNEFSGGTWPGKPDVYHAAQCVLMPTLPLAASFAGALAG